jgi:hypothetical protein
MNLEDQLMRVECGFSLPLSHLGLFSLMDEKGNIRERDVRRAARSSREVVSDLRAWRRLVDLMVRDTPSHRGGRRLESAT